MVIIWRQAGGPLPIERRYRTQPRGFKNYKGKHPPWFLLRPAFGSQADLRGYISGDLCDR